MGMNMTTTADFLRMIGDALSTTLRDLTNRAKTAEFEGGYAWESFRWNPATATLTLRYHEPFDNGQRVRAGIDVRLSYWTSTEVTSGSDDWTGVR